MTTSPNPQTVFVTGGAGFLGINLVRLLLERGCHVVSFDIAPFDYPEKDRLTARDRRYSPVGGDESAMQGCDAVVHCAAALPLYTEADIFSTDVDGTRNVMEAARQLGIARVVYISSTAVYGVPDHHPLYETDEMIGVGPYGKAKIAGGAAMRRLPQSRHIRAHHPPEIFHRPGTPGRLRAAFTTGRIDGHNFPILGGGTNRYQLLDVADLCDAIWICLTEPKDVVNDIFQHRRERIHHHARRFPGGAG